MSLSKSAKREGELLFRQQFKNEYWAKTLLNYGYQNSQVADGYTLDSSYIWRPVEKVNAYSSLNDKLISILNEINKEEIKFFNFHFRKVKINSQKPIPQCQYDVYRDAPDYTILWYPKLDSTLEHDGVLLLTPAGDTKEKVQEKVQVKENDLLILRGNYDEGNFKGTGEYCIYLLHISTTTEDTGDGDLPREWSHCECSVSK
jgi:hypothetical protein